MSQRDTVIHLVAGGVAGTVGAIVTCPLEVVKTRLQSSHGTFAPRTIHPILPTAPMPYPAHPLALIHTTTNPNSTQTTCRTIPTDKSHSPTRTSSNRESSSNSNNSTRRWLWTSCRQLRPQAVVALSGYAGPVSAVGAAGAAAAAASMKASAAGKAAAAGASRLVPQQNAGLIQCLRHIVKYEGTMALFKGLGPNLVGVAPSRAVYFCTYSQAKLFWNNVLVPDTAMVHMLSASCAGFMASTLTNPIWFVKTRLQLDCGKENRMTAFECVRRIYSKSGILGFYKGITASYMGISETIVHFVIYEAIKAELIRYHHANRRNSNERDSRDFLEFMVAGAASKTVASCIAYPHEVARTRLREEGNKYKSFWQTLTLVAKEEGIRGVYRGLTTQLVRQIPNTAIMMATYEAVVYLLSTRFRTDFYTKDEHA